MPIHPRKLLILLWLLAAPARAYVDLAPTLAGVIRDAQQISVVEVDRFNSEKGVVILKPVRDLKGHSGSDPIRHHVVVAQTSIIPRHILDWAEPGQRGVLFVSSNVSLVCVGTGWYQAQGSADGWATLGPARPDLPLAYYGSVWRLIDALSLMLEGKDAVITTLPHGATGEGASFDLALNRPSLPGAVRVQRMRANLKMALVVLAVSSSPAFVVGQGPAGEEDIPTLVAKLKAADAQTRADAADDLRTLGPKAAPAVDALGQLLDDASAVARASAAGALVQICPRDQRPVQLLGKWLTDADPLLRRHAAHAVARANIASLAEKVMPLLADKDQRVRAAALQAVATLGPAAACATEAVARLLDDPVMVADAADARGRIGPAARPALKRIAPLLSSESDTLNWAAVRAMSQIGGEDAAPAVHFMIRKLKDCSDFDGYNMMIYLALMGPVARPAIEAIESSRIRNPVLKPACIWAIEADKRLPWSNTGRPGMVMRDADFARFIFESFIHELGDRLKPASRLLAQKILDGSAGDVPAWGYKILGRNPADAMQVLVPALADPEIVQRERAAVALGYMGPAAADAKARVSAVAAKAPTEREQRLLMWCLRQISAPAPSAQ